MCSPELTRGMCRICTGTLTPETTYVDRHGNRWDVHKGVCAIEAGEIDEVPLYHQSQYGVYMQRIHNASTAEVRRVIVGAFVKWVREIARENHYFSENSRDPS
jgi:hypothetical protein